MAKDKKTSKFSTVNGVKLYRTSEIVKDSYPTPFTLTVLPEGLKPYDTELVNVGYIPPGADQPTYARMTGYGASYMSKVLSGTERAREIMINVFANNEKGHMLQLTATVWDAVNDQPKDNYNATKLAIQAISSLPDAIKAKFLNAKLLVEAGTSPVKAGFVPVTVA